MQVLLAAVLMLAMSENIDVFNEATIWCKGKVKTLCREMEQFSLYEIYMI